MLILHPGAAQVVLERVIEQADAGGSPSLRLYGGVAPAPDAVIASQYLLATIPCRSPCGMVVGRSINLSLMPSVAVGSGLATFFRLVSSSGETIVQGPVRIALSADSPIAMTKARITLLGEVPPAGILGATIPLTASAAGTAESIPAIPFMLEIGGISDRYGAEWSQSYSSGFFESASEFRMIEHSYTIGVDSSNSIYHGFSAGLFYNRPTQFIYKYSATGETVWGRALDFDLAGATVSDALTRSGSNVVRAAKIKCDTNGGVYLVGGCTITLTDSATAKIVGVVAKLSSSGDLLWSKVFAHSTDYEESIFDIAISPDGNDVAILSRRAVTKLSANDGSVIWRRNTNFSGSYTPYCVSLVATTDDNIALLTECDTAAHTSRYFMIEKIDWNGATIFANGYSSTGDTEDSGSRLAFLTGSPGQFSGVPRADIQTDSAGNFYVAKANTYTTKIMVYKFASDGSSVWQRYIRFDPVLYTAAIVGDIYVAECKTSVQSDGSVVIIANVQMPSSISMRLVVIRLDSSGSLISQHAYAHSNMQSDEGHLSDIIANGDYINFALSEQDVSVEYLRKNSINIFRIPPVLGETYDYGKGSFYTLPSVIDNLGMSIDPFTFHADVANPYVNWSLSNSTTQVATVSTVVLDSVTDSKFNPTVNFEIEIPTPVGNYWISNAADAPALIFESGWGRSISDSAGNIYSCAYRNQDSLVTKRDSAGNILWSFSYKTTSYLYVFTVQAAMFCDDTHVVIFGSDGGIAKILCSDGSLIFASSITGVNAALDTFIHNSTLYAVYKITSGIGIATMNATTGVYISGTSLPTANGNLTNATYRDGFLYVVWVDYFRTFLAKIDLTNPTQFVWIKDIKDYDRHGSGWMPVVRTSVEELTVDSGGNIYLSLEVRTISSPTPTEPNILGTMKVDPSGNAVWKKNYRSPSYIMQHDMSYTGRTLTIVGDKLVRVVSDTYDLSRAIMVIDVATGDLAWAKTLAYSASRGFGDSEGHTITSNNDGVDNALLFSTSEFESYSRLKILRLPMTGDFGSQDSLLIRDMVLNTEEMPATLGTTTFDPLVYVGGTIVAGNTVSLTSLTGGIDTQARTGDLVVVAYTVDSTTNLFLDMESAGWVGYADLYSSDDYDTNLRVYYKSMGDTPDISAIHQNLGANQIICAQVWRGEFVLYTSGQSTTINGAQPNHGSLSFANDRRQVVTYFAAGASDTATAFTSTDLTGFQSLAVNGTGATILGMGYHVNEIGDPTTFDPTIFGGGSTSLSASHAKFYFRFDTPAPPAAIASSSYTVTSRTSVTTPISPLTSADHVIILENLK